MKVAENREEPFKKDIATNYVDEDTYYVRNADDNRSRRDIWKQERYVRSDSRPGYLRPSHWSFSCNWNNYHIITF